MEVERLLYTYLAICFSMIIFNCVCIFTFKHSDKRIRRKSTDFEVRIIGQISLMKQGELPNEKHMKYLRRKLKRIGNLIALDETMERLFVKEPEAVKAYLVSIRSVFLYLAQEYHHKESIQAAYFPYILKRFHILQDKSSGMLLDILMDFLNKPSLYCRENALQAIYSAGDCDSVVKALKIIDSNSYFHHSKLLSDGLMEFTGSHKQLSEAIWRSFQDFSPQMKLTLLNYIRFNNPDFREETLTLLTDETQDDEIRFACIRYVGKYYDRAAYPVLLDFAENAEKRRWEYAAIAASALAIYPSERTVRVLKQSLYSSNWYIRFNASESLEHIGLNYAEFADVFDSNDRYAREILQYRLDQRHAKEEEKKEEKQAEKQEVMQA